MGLFFNKNKKGKVVDAVTEDKERIARNLSAIGKLKIVLESVPEICARLDEVKKSYEFASPKNSPETLAVDQKIGEALDDVERRAETAEKTGDYSEIEGLIKKVRILIAGR